MEQEKDTENTPEDGGLPETDFTNHIPTIGLKCRYEYDKTCYIESGCWGTVYKATIVDRESFPDLTQVAVKRMEYDAEEWALFTKQWKKWNLEDLVTLKHENIISYHKVTPFKADNGTASIEFLMDYSEDIKLANIIRSFKERKQRLPIRTVLDYSRQIATGLAYLHENKYAVYRDLSVETVYVSVPVGNQNLVRIGHYDKSNYSKHDQRRRRDEEQIEYDRVCGDVSDQLQDYVYQGLLEAFERTLEPAHNSSLATDNYIQKKLLEALPDFKEKIAFAINVPPYNNGNFPEFLATKVLWAIHEKIRDLFASETQLQQLNPKFFRCVLPIAEFVLKKVAEYIAKPLRDMDQLGPAAYTLASYQEHVNLYGSIMKDLRAFLKTWFSQRRAVGGFHACNPCNLLPPRLDVCFLGLIIYNLCTCCFDVKDEDAKINAASEHESFQFNADDISIGWFAKRMFECSVLVLDCPASVPVELFETIRTCLATYSWSITATQIRDRLVQIEEVTYGKTWMTDTKNVESDDNNGVTGVTEDHRPIREDIGYDCEYTYKFPDNCIGQGAFGTVYKALVTDMGTYKGDEIVAVKEIAWSLPHFKQLKKEKWRSIQQLWQSLVKLRHPNLVAYYKVTIKRSLKGLGIDFLMDYCDGGDIAALIGQHKLGKSKISLQAAIAFSAQIANGLSFLHDHHFIHGDLKPNNIMVKRTALGNQLLIGDLDSVVLVYNHTEFSNSSQSGIAIDHFTITYMSPELVAKNFKQVDQLIDYKTDVWSFGCIMLDLIDCCFNTDERCFHKYLEEEKKVDKIKCGDYAARRFAFLLADGYVPYISETIPQILADLIRSCLVEQSRRISSESIADALWNLCMAANEMQKDEGMDVPTISRSADSAPISQNLSRFIKSRLVENSMKRSSADIMNIFKSMHSNEVADVTDVTDENTDVTTFSQFAASGTIPQYLVDLFKSYLAEEVEKMSTADIANAMKSMYYSYGVNRKVEDTIVSTIAAATIDSLHTKTEKNNCSSADASIRAPRTAVARMERNTNEMVKCTVEVRQNILTPVLQSQSANCSQANTTAEKKLVLRASNEFAQKLTYGCDCGLEHAYSAWCDYDDRPADVAAGKIDDLGVPYPFGKREDPKAWIHDVYQNVGEKYDLVWDTFSVGHIEVALYFLRRYTKKYNHAVGGLDYHYILQGNLTYSTFFDGDFGVQMIHDALHWQVLVRRDIDVYFYCPLGSELSSEMKRIIGHLMRLREGDTVVVHRKRCQQLQNGSVSGLYAVAMATAAVYQEDPGEVTFDPTLMLEHLKECIEKKFLTPFKRALTDECIPFTPVQNTVEVITIPRLWHTNPGLQYTMLKDKVYHFT